MILIHIASDQQIAAVRHAAHAVVGCTWDVGTIHLQGAVWQFGSGRIAVLLSAVRAQ